MPLFEKVEPNLATKTPRAPRRAFKGLGSKRVFDLFFLESLCLGGKKVLNLL
jgi:hypothetical protein